MAGIIEEFLILFKPTVQGTGFQKLNKHIKQTSNNLLNAKNLFRSFVGYDLYTGGKAILGSLIGASKELGAMESRFYAITHSEELANKELQWTFDLAKKTAMPLKETADSYSIFYAATQKGLGTKGAREVFQDWTEVSRVLHLSTYQFERVTYALREMASKGAIYSQDLRMQIGTHVPNAMGLAEKAVNQLGYTGANWFEDFRKASKGNQKLINQFIVLFSRMAKEQFASESAMREAMKKTDAQLVKLKQHWDEFRYAMAKGRFGDDLSKALIALNAILDKLIGNSDKINATYNLLRDIAKIVALIFGAKYFRVFIKFLGRTGNLIWSIIRAVEKGAYRIMHPIKTLKALFKFGKIKFFDAIFGKGLGALGKNLLKKFGLKGLFKMLGRKVFLGLLGKAILAFIPGIGQIIFVLWTLWDVIDLIISAIGIFFPKLGRWLRLTKEIIIENILHPIRAIKNAWNDFLNGEESKKTSGTSGVSFPQGTIPDENKPNFGLYARKFSYNDILPYKSTIGQMTQPNVHNYIENKIDIHGANITADEVQRIINNNNDNLISKIEEKNRYAISGSKY